jgi:hypothetical protein
MASRKPSIFGRERPQSRRLSRSNSQAASGTDSAESRSRQEVLQETIGSLVDSWDSISARLDDIETHAKDVSNWIEKTLDEASRRSSFASPSTYVHPSNSQDFKAMRKEMKVMASRIDELCNASVANGDLASLKEKAWTLERDLGEIRRSADARSLCDSKRLQTFHDLTSTKAASSVTGSSYVSLYTFKNPQAQELIIGHVAMLPGLKSRQEVIMEANAIARRECSGAKAFYTHRETTKVCAVESRNGWSYSRREF